MDVFPEGDHGKHAVTHYKVVERFGYVTLIECKLETGRTHQIRVHLAWLRHPVVGDETYGGGRDNTIQDARYRAQVRSLDRQFLHARKLAFTHPTTEQRMEFEAPLPDELSMLLKGLEEG